MEPPPARELVEVCRFGDLAGTGRQVVDVDGVSVVVLRASQGVVAFVNRCPHMGLNLDTGRLRGDVLTCAHHGRRYDLRDGRRLVEWWRGRPRLTSRLRMLRVEVADGRVYVERPAPWPADPPSP